MNREELLARFSRSDLGEAERRGLFEAALDDQELFDTLVEEDALRELLDHGETRAELLARLGEVPVPAPRTRLRLTFAVAASVAIITTVALLHHSALPPDLLRLSRGPSLEAAALWRDTEAPAKMLATLSADLRLAPGAAGPGRLRPGEALTLTASVSEPAHVVLLVCPPDGKAQLLFPRGDPPVLRLAPQSPLRSSHTAPGAPGRYHLRLVVIGAEEGDAPLDWGVLRARAAAGETVVADAAFEVLR